MGSSLLKRKTVKFLSMTRDELEKAFSNESCLFVPTLALTTSKSKNFREAFINLLPGEKVTFTQREESSLSLTCLNGNSELCHPKIPPIGLSSHLDSYCFYVRFESIVGEFVITNPYDEPVIIQVVSGRSLNSIFSTCDLSSKSPRPIYRTEDSFLDKENERVFRIVPAYVKSLGNYQITKLRENIVDSKERQGRICCHQHDSSMMQEMFLSFDQGTTFPIMKHLDKSESLLVLDGSLVYRIYDDFGEIIGQVSMHGFQMKNCSASDPFYIWINRDTFHSPLVNSTALLAKETTSGPFKPSDTVLLDLDL